LPDIANESSAYIPDIQKSVRKHNQYETKRRELARRQAVLVGYNR